MAGDFLDQLMGSPPIDLPEIKILKGTTVADGLFNAERVQSTPKFISTSGEKILNKGNAYFILGNDRPTDIASGYGGKGSTNAAAIDICVGLGGVSSNSTKALDRNFGSGKVPGDASRIYISQKSDIDDYMGLATGGDGAEGNRSIAKAAIGIVSDDIRLSARRAIKLTTKSAFSNDSQGYKKNKIFGIDLIAGNHEEVDQESGFSYLQPMVKGNNLAMLLSRIQNQIKILNSRETKDIQISRKMKIATATDLIQGIDAMGMPVASYHSYNSYIELIDYLFDSLDIEARLNFEGTYRVLGTQMTFLNEAGKYSILSPHNRVN